MVGVVEASSEYVHQNILLTWAKVKRPGEFAPEYGVIYFLRLCVNVQRQHLTIA